MEKTMTAAVLHAPGDLRIEEIPVPRRPEGDEALIRVAMAGICGSDLGRIQHTGTYSFPTVPGHEFAGEIAEIAKNPVGLKKGDRVAVAPILPCFHCDNCAVGDYGQCDDYNYLGSRTDGGFAGYVTAPIRNLVPLPDSVSFRHAALIEPAAVTLHGMMRLDIRAGDTIMVLGCGAIGLFAVSFARILGATRIIAVDIDDDKLELARKAGATLLSNSKREDACDLYKADIVVETAGVSATQTGAVRGVRKNGQILYLGTAHHDVVFPPKVFERIVRNELRIAGSWNSFSAPFPGREWRAVVDYMGSGALDMELFISHTISLSELPGFIAGMDRREFSFNKVLVSPGG